MRQNTEVSWRIVLFGYYLLTASTHHRCIVRGLIIVGVNGPYGGYPMESMMSSSWLDIDNDLEFTKGIDWYL